ncbi:MAG: hypothetical protein V1495_00935 [Pseudomonadota bacterium]
MTLRLEPEFRNALGERALDYGETITEFIYATLVDHETGMRWGESLPKGPSPQWSNQNKTVNLRVVINERTQGQLEGVAKKNAVSLSEVIRRVLVDELENPPEVYVRRKKKPQNQGRAKRLDYTKKPALIGIARYHSREISSFVRQLANELHLSVGALHEKLVYEALQKRFGETFLKSLEAFQETEKHRRREFFKGIRRK